MYRYIPFFISVIVGITTWLGIGIWSGRNEAWDSQLYWSVGYPAMIISVLIIAFVWPEKPWRWAITLIATHAIVGFLQTLSQANLWPFSLIIFFILSIPLVLSAYVGSIVKKRVIGHG